MLFTLENVKNFDFAVGNALLDIIDISYVVNLCKLQMGYPVSKDTIFYSK